MSATKLKQRLRQAMRLYEGARVSGDSLGIPGFLEGVRRGFQETMRIIRELHEEDLQVVRRTRQPLTRWNAIILYRACQGAYRRLVLSDRLGAMKILRRALDKVKTQPKADSEAQASR